MSSSRARLFDSSVGTKILIGLTGLGLVLYLVAHIAGNLLVLLGPETFNEYSHVLLGNPLIPVIEVGLLLVLVVHMYKTARMQLANRAARPVRYEQKKPAGGSSRKSLASSTMIFSGAWLLLFMIVHVATFKYGPVYEAAGGVRDLYRLEMENFGNPLTVVFYVISMLVVGSHLWHGSSSAFQSTGLVHSRWTPRVLVAGKAFAVIVAGGFALIAVWAFFTGGRP